MARLLVAGATGLIGAELVRQAQAAGHEVTRICRRPDASPVRTLIADLYRPDELPQRLPSEAFDCVLYLAQGDNHNDFPANASNAVAINVAAPLALCQWAVASGSRRFAYASSGGICGPAPEGGRIAETATTLAAPQLSFYLSTKARCEQLLRHFEPHIGVAVLRYFFVYGASQRPQFLFTRLADRVRRGEPVELAGGVGAVINPVHVADAAALTLAAACGDAGGTFNIAGLEDVTIADVAGRIARALGAPLLRKDTPGAVARYLADTARMQRALGLPRVGLDEGIRRSFGEGVNT